MVISIEMKRVSPEVIRIQPPRFSQIMETVRKEIPIDGVEITGWMQKCGSINRALSP